MQTRLVPGAGAGVLAATMTPLDQALLGLLHKIVIAPPASDGSKRPMSPFRETWADLRNRPYTEKEIQSIYEVLTSCTGVGVLTGACSGGLECLDFDDREAFAEFETACIQGGLGDLLTRVADGYLEASPNGMHLLWRCAEIAGNQKLAKSGTKCRIETRGEGGFVIIAPSHGPVNASGEYHLRRGGLGTIVTITTEERRQLLEVARSLGDPMHKPEEKYSRENAENSGKPGDEFNALARWEDILGPHGWTYCGAVGGVTRWRRPGKQVGISATTNWQGSGLLYVFSSSTEFEPERGYSKFAAYAILNHHGDFSAAAADLAEQGFGDEASEPMPDFQPAEPPGVQPVELVEPAQPETPDCRNQFGSPMPEHLIQVPGFIGEFAEYINRTSYKRQPVLALASSIAAMASILGQRVRTTRDTRSNLYVLGVAETGAGKERGRQAIKQLMSAIGEDVRISMEDVTSDAAIYRGLEEHPCSLALMDEFGRILRSIQQADTGGGSMATVSNALLRLYSSSSTCVVGKMYAQRDPVKIDQPCLSVYGTTVPTSLLRSISPENLIDGLMNRILIFFSEDDDPEELDGDFLEPLPQSLIAQARAWVDFPTARDGSGVCPKTVKTHDRGKAVLRALRDRLRAQRADLTHGDQRSLQIALWSRASLQAEKLALLHACSSMGPHRPWPIITEESATWGADMATYLTNKANTVLLDRVAENEEDEFAQAILRVVREHGQASKEQIGRTSGPTGVRRHVVQRRGRSALTEKLTALVDVGLLRVHQVGKAKIYSPGK